MVNGQFQIYTGNGKGKTTAALGLALRASGAGLRVYFGQFIKDSEYSEIKRLRELPGLTVEQYGTGNGCFIGREPTEADIICAEGGLERLRSVMLSGRYDVVIADEINCAFGLKLLTEGQLTELAALRPLEVELIFTGRWAPKALMEMADLVTEMREVKHYYSTKNLQARTGIEC
jgi:cob(I)alamin adenosyltransferase